VASINLDAARRTFVSTLAQCEQAETRAQRLLEAAATQRDTDLTRIRQKQTSWRQRCDASLSQAREALREADRILMQLRLGQARLAPPATSTPPTAIDQIERQLQAACDAAKRQLVALRSTADRLTAERMKWWKPW
jgi:DNA repair exonuclease SbcCD ATPase subunit